MSYNFIYDGVSSEQFGTYLASSNFMDGPDRDVTAVSIPGRNGDLIIDNGRYKNFPLEQHAYVKGNLVENMDALKNFLGQHQSSYYVLEESLCPDVFRMARVADGFAMGAHGDTNGAFTIRYDCKPQRFLKSGTVPMQFLPTYSKATMMIPVNSENLVLTAHSDGGSVPVVVTTYNSSETLVNTYSYTLSSGDTRTVTFGSTEEYWQISSSEYFDPYKYVQVKTVSVHNNKPVQIDAKVVRSWNFQNPTGYATTPLYEVYADELPNIHMYNYDAITAPPYEEYTFRLKNGASISSEHFYMDCDLQYLYNEDGTNETGKLYLTDITSEHGKGLIFPGLGRNVIRMMMSYTSAINGLGLFIIYPRWWKT